MPSLLLWNNVIPAVGLTSSSEDPLYTLDKLVDRVAGETFRFGAAGGGWIQADLAVATAITEIGIVNHNITATGTIRIDVGNTDPPGTLLAEPVWRERDIRVAASANHRYIRMTISDPANELPVEIGQWTAGVPETLPRARRWGMNRGTERREIVHETVDGVVWAYRRRYADARGYSWRVMRSEMETFRLLDRRLGRVRPFLWVEDSAGVDCIYARISRAHFEARELAEGIAVSGGADGAYDLDWELAEESRGSEVLA